MFLSDTHILIRDRGDMLDISNDVRGEAKSVLSAKRTLALFLSAYVSTGFLIQLFTCYTCDNNPTLKGSKESHPHTITSLS